MLVRNLWRRQTRTILTLLGIAVGIAALVTLVALSKGFSTSFTEASGRTDAHVTLQAVQTQGQAITMGTGFDEGVLAQVRAMPEVKAAFGMLYSFSPMPNVPFFIVYGYEPEQYGVRHFKLIRGVTLADYRQRAGGKPMLLGTTAAKNLRKDVGDTVQLKEVTFRIVGIFETGVGLEDAAAVISLRDAQTLASLPHQVMYVGIQLQRPDYAEEFKAKLARSLPKDVEIAGTQAGNMLLEMFSLMDGFAWAVAMIAALVGGVGMMNTMLMSVFERTREIGVLRAVGWSRGRVLALILGESLLLSLLGGAIGLGLGAGLVWLVAHTPAMEGMTTDTVPLPLIAQALSATMILGLVGGLYPAWRASRLAPIEALSYDGGNQRRSLKLPFGGMALKSILRQSTRTVLTMLGVGIGVLGMLLVGSVQEGAVATMNTMYSGTDLTAAEGGLADTSLSAIDERILKRIEAMPEVQYVTGMHFAAVSTRNAAFFMITAREPSDPFLNPSILKEGRLMTSRRECLMGWKGAIEQEKKVGDRITFLGATFTVVGIVETGSTYEDGGAIISLSEAQQLLKKPHQVMLMSIKLKDPAQTEVVRARLAAEYPKLVFARSAEFTENLSDMENMRVMFNAIFLLTLLVGSIALMNTMVMSIYERTREIGVLRAVGWRASMVLREMLAESLILTLSSGALGFVSAWLLIAGMRAMPSLGVMRESFAITPVVAGEALALCLVLGVVGGLYPAWRATRLSPVEALRYE